MLESNNTATSSSNIVIMKGDSAASKHYLREEDQRVLTNVKTYDGPPVTLPDADQLTTTKQGSLPLSSRLSTNAKRATISKKSQKFFVNFSWSSL